MAEDLFGIKRRIGGKSVTEKDILPYLQREVMPELKAIRGLLDRMISANEETMASVSNSVGLKTNGIQSSFAQVYKTSTAPSTRVSFDASRYPVVNLARVRSIDIDYWLDADVNGGSPEVALFNAATGVEISGTRVAHTTGTSSSRSVATDIPVGSGAADLPDEETVLYVKARDQDSVAIVTVVQVRILVRYVDSEV